MGRSTTVKSWWQMWHVKSWWHEIFPVEWDIVPIWGFEIPFHLQGSLPMHICRFCDRNPLFDLQYLPSIDMYQLIYTYIESCIYIYVYRYYVYIYIRIYMETGIVQRLYPNYDYWSPFRMWFWHQVLFFLGILLVVAVLFMRIETPITCSKPHLYFFGIETQSLINMQIYWTPSWITVTPIFLYFGSNFHLFFVSEPQISKCSEVLVGET